jgi:hypothetical protein
MVPAGGKKCTQCGKSLSGAATNTSAVTRFLGKFGSGLVTAAKRQADSLKTSLNDGAQPRLVSQRSEQGGPSVLNNIEQKIIFNFTRWVALTAIILLFIGIVISFLAYRSIGDWKYISYETVGKALDPPEVKAERTIQESLPEIEIPDSVERHLRGKNKAVLLGWLGDLEEEEKADFLVNLDHIIMEAARKNPDKVIDYINKYRELKFSKVKENPFNAYIDKAARTGFLISILLIIGTIGLFSMVLVMLAVERNTRIFLSKNR